MPLNEFKLVEETYKINKDFIKSYNYDSDEGFFHEVDFQNLANLHNLYSDLLFLLHRMKTRSKFAI